MTVIFTETFEGVAGDPWDAAKWVQRITDESSSLTIDSANRGLMTSSGTTYANVRAVADTVDVAHADVTGKFVHTASTTKYGSVGFRADYTGSADRLPYNGYILELSIDSANNVVVKIRRLDAGTPTTVSGQATIAMGSTPTTMAFRIRYESGALKGKVWEANQAEPDAWTVEASDTTFTTGKVGLGLLGTSSGSAKELPWDDISINTITADTTPPTVAMDEIHPAGPAYDLHASPGYDAATDILTISGTASDDVAVDRVEVTIGGGTPVTATGTTAWSLDVGLSTIAAGSHVVTATAFDTSENKTATSQTVWHSPDGLYGAAPVAGNHLTPVTSEVYE